MPREVFARDSESAEPLLTSHTDFELPGLKNPTARAKLIVALVFAYSLRANMRRLEDHFYPFWQLVVDYLVADDVYLMGGQQVTFWWTDQQLDPNTSNVTIKGSNNERKPDFNIMGLETCNRNITYTKTLPDPRFPGFPKELGRWNVMRLVACEPRLLGEGKRPPSRQISDPQELFDELQTQLARAQKDVINQADLTFMQYPNCETLVLMSVVGEWWSFAIRQRPSKEELEESVNDVFVPGSETDDDDGNNHDAEEEEEEEEEEGDIDEVIVDDDDDFQAGDILRQIPQQYMEKVHDHFSDCKPNGDSLFSAVMLFDTPASNQCFYFILDYMRQRTTHVEDVYAEPPPPPEDHDPIDGYKVDTYTRSRPGRPLSEWSRGNRDRIAANLAARSQRDGPDPVNSDDDELKL
ncbi:hypothetical protein H0H93_006192 [Arthromyces matolae]|nr:hypothetical protein H0H93_006192 [Arthromyces matolae]